MKTVDSKACVTCGHPVKSHRHGGANTHGNYRFLSSCKKRDCDCEHYVHPEKGPLRDEGRV